MSLVFKNFLVFDQKVPICLMIDEHWAFYYYSRNYKNDLKIFSIACRSSFGWTSRNGCQRRFGTSIDEYEALIFAGFGRIGFLFYSIHILLIYYYSRNHPIFLNPTNISWSSHFNALRRLSFIYVKIPMLNYNGVAKYRIMKKNNSIIGNQSDYVGKEAKFLTVSRRIFAGFLKYSTKNKLYYYLL